MNCRKEPTNLGAKCRADEGRCANGSGVCIDMNAGEGQPWNDSTKTCMPRCDGDGRCPNGTDAFNWALAPECFCSAGSVATPDESARAKRLPRNPVFKCRKSGFQGGPWRECAPNITRCDEYGCFERETAFCFPVLFKNFDGSPDKQWTICAPSSRECEEWNEDRKHVPNRSLGPCVEMHPDEYRDLEE